MTKREFYDVEDAHYVHTEAPGLELRLIPCVDGRLEVTAFVHDFEMSITFTIANQRMDVIRDVCQELIDGRVDTESVG